jgi:peptidoglycan hydrolase CwlO-like protein
LIFSDLEQELGDKQASVQLLEREVTEGRRRCTELEVELDQVNKDIGEARVWKFAFKRNHISSFS